MEGGQAEDAGCGAVNKGFVAMSASLATRARAWPTPARPRVPSALSLSIWRAPLVPLALAGTSGIVLDRYVNVPLAFTLVAAAAALVGWISTVHGATAGPPLIFLWAGVGALGAAFHQNYRGAYAADDIGRFATSEPRPVLVRGFLESEPTIVWQARNHLLVSRQERINPLRSFPQEDSTRVVVRVTTVKQADDWQSASGLAQVTVQGHLQGLHVGDEVEVAGRLQEPQGPGNPGEFDYASYLQDQRIRAVISVHKTPEGVVRLAEHWPKTLAGWLAVIRGWGVETLERAISPDHSGVAAALLLGEGSTATGHIPHLKPGFVDWEQYIKTGVIHVLAISGQHLVVLAGFLWLGLRLLGVRRARGACLVAVFLLLYALLAGGRPPVLRSAVGVCAVCGGMLLARPVLPANTFALSWIVVALLNPTDLFTAGCQLSFLSVAVLYWGVSRWADREPDPLQRLIDESRPRWLRALRWLGKQVLFSYVVTLAIWAAVAPLVAARYNMLSIVGLLIGPPTVLLTSVALLAGFLLLLLAPICWPLAQLCGWVTQGSLAACDGLVHASAGWPFAYVYVGNVPAWWLWGFYLGLLAFLLVGPLRRQVPWAIPAALAWLCVGLIAGAVPTAPREFRCTFVAVGHGGCTVLETPDCRTLLYDAGALSGPDVTRRQIAPFLWSRGIRRVDEVMLSHADLDHFNGLPALLERFAVGQVTCTPTFADKTTAGVKETLNVLRRHGIPMRVVKAGDRLVAGQVHINVLHPPAVGPEGNENSRSMVLLVRHGGQSLLLTGDLEGPGLERVLGLPPARVDVLQAPHHGSRVANTPALAAWARPSIVVSCQEPPRRPGLAEEPYSALGARFLPTWAQGAITLRCEEAGLVVETFRTRQRWIVSSMEAP
jgi:competence protein ComEC